MSRCVAIAAHGKRCQQSPFRGSPYCWHHTQSRKVWAPSRPLGAGPLGNPAGIPRAGADGADPARTAPAPAPQEALAVETDGDLARRAADLLGPELLEELVAFLEGAGDDSLVLRRDDGRLAEPRVRAPQRSERARRAAG